MPQAQRFGACSTYGTTMALTANTVLLFGATGDLAQRMLLPSLFALHADRLLPPDLAILGTARTDINDDDFRALAGAALAKYLPLDRHSSVANSDFLKRLRYTASDASDPKSFAGLSKSLGNGEGRPIAVLLSIAPSLFKQAISGLQSAGLTGDDARIGLEKPLGHDLASFRVIDDAVRAAFPEERIFRIDHYLGKETVQNLLALRFANRLFEPLWNASGVDHIQITVSETVGLEGRGAFYDEAGALRDMVQNHMLQLLALVAMEPPAHFNATEVRDEKVKVLRSLRSIDQAAAPTHSVIGQYAAGVVRGSWVPGYIEELGAPSGTETFAALKAHVDNWRWRGVPFYLRTGKRLANRQSEIFIQLRQVPHSIFESGGALVQPNKLIIRLQPEENIRLLVMAKEPGLDRDGIRLREVPLDLSLTSAFAGARRRIAYERLLLDFIEGDPTLFVRRDEIETQWEWIDGIRDGWASHQIRPQTYAAGTWGPSAAIALTERDGVRWHD
jgi:glucose-6-phosphate 1-dehydrogenase